MTDQPIYLSITKYAKRYGVDRHTVYKWLELGVLEHYRVLTVIRIKDAPPDQHTRSVAISPSSAVPVTNTQV